MNEEYIYSLKQKSKGSLGLSQCWIQAIFHEADSLHLASAFLSPHSILRQDPSLQWQGGQQRLQASFLFSQQPSTERLALFPK